MNRANERRARGLGGALVAISGALLGCGGADAVAGSGSAAGSGSVATAGSAAGAGSGSGSAACPVCPVCAVCDPEPDQTGARDTLTLTRAAFADLPAWADDKHGEAIGSFLRSCAELAKLADTALVGNDGRGGVAKQWRGACAAAAKVKPSDHAAARAFFEREFTPWAAESKKRPAGLFTGYMVQDMRASRKRGGVYQHPVYGRPKDLISVDLGDFIKDPNARRVWGRINGKGALVPYYTRKEIRTGALDGRGLEIVYADSAIDVVFAHIQGTAKVTLDDGKTMWLEYAGKNGRAFRGVGGTLKAMGAFKPPAYGSMQDIRAWLDKNAARFDEVVDQSPSFVFFQEGKRGGAIGTQGVVLVAQRSMAVDRAFVALGTPVWVDIKAPNPGKPGTAPWRRMLIAQDTGGAILGAVRGDIYWGEDAAAADRAGRMSSTGRYWLLLPNGVGK